MTRTWKLKTFADGTPFVHYPPYPTGPALVSYNGWNAGGATGAHIDGYRVSAFKVVSENPYEAEYHPLHGQLFPTTEEAHRAQYEAGLLAYMVYDDSEWADKKKPIDDTATWDVINELGKDRPEGRRRGEVWEAMTSASWEAFRDDALRWLKDQSELSEKQLNNADWEYVYETFYPEGDEKECEGHESLDGAHMGETVYCDGTCR